MAINGYFNSIALGDHCFLEPGYDVELEIKKIPRADGCIVRRRGGGVQTLTVHAWVVKNSRVNIESYLAQLATSFGTAGANLVINGVTYSNTFFQDMSPGSDDHQWNYFSCSFVRNAE